MKTNEALQFNDRDLIENIVQSYYIVDFGFIKTVNADGTVDVVHAKKGRLLDGQKLPECETKGLEVLTISCAEFSLKLTPKKGDNVLLLGFKDYIEKAGDIKQAEDIDVCIHYQRNTMKALPVSLFNSDAKVTLNLDGGNINLGCKKFTVGDKNAPALEVTP